MWGYILSAIIGAAVGYFLLWLYFVINGPRL